MLILRVKYQCLSMATESTEEHGKISMNSLPDPSFRSKRGVDPESSLDVLSVTG